MAIIRQSNFLGQQRIDVPHLRAIESGVAADFDVLAGKIMAGTEALVVKGFEISMSGAVGSSATSLQLLTADSVLLHPNASEAGTVFAVPATEDVQTLNSSNAKVEGSFTASSINYIGIDLIRQADDATADLVKFIDPVTKAEVSKTVPLARTLQYLISISTIDFDATPRVAPVAKVTVDSTGIVTAIEDCRPLFFRLGAGGSNPDNQSFFPWAQGRTELTTGESLFEGGDKAIQSDKMWRDAIMTRLWEIGGGEFWYNATSDRDTKLTFSSDVLPATGTNFDWDLGAETFEWGGVSIVFANTTGWYNDINDGSEVLEDGECLYFDVDRSANRTGGTALTVAKAVLTELGAPSVPGSRFIFAWRKGDDVFVRDYPFETGRNLGLPLPGGDPLNVLFEGPGGVSYWGRLTTDMILDILSILTFVAAIPVVEKGATVVTPAFTASYAAGPATSALLDDNDGSAQKNVSGTPTSFASNTTFTKTTVGSNPVVTFTLTAHAGATPDTATTTVSWYRYNYSGTDVSASPTLNSAYVKALDSTTGGSKSLTSGKSRRIQMLGGNAPANAYVYFAYPTYHGTLSQVVDNLTSFVVTSAFTLVGTANSVTTVGTNTIGENYYVYRSNQLQNSALDWTIS